MTNATRGLFINSFFGRYGLSENLSLVGYVPHTRVYQNKQVYSSGRAPLAGEEFSSLGDINLGLDYQWYRKKGWAISTSLTLGLPTGNNSGGSDGSYQTGDGEFNQVVRLHFGRSYRLGKQRFYASYLWGEPTQQRLFRWVRAGVETGTKIIDQKILVLGRLNLIESFQNGNLDATTSNGSIFANNVEVVSLGGEMIFDVYKNWRFSLSASYPVRGKLIYRAPALSTGISLQL